MLLSWNWAFFCFSVPQHFPNWSCLTPRTEWPKDNYGLEASPNGWRPRPTVATFQVGRITFSPGTNCSPLKKTSQNEEAKNHFLLVFWPPNIWGIVPTDGQSLNDRIWNDEYLKETIARCGPTLPHQNFFSQKSKAPDFASFQKKTRFFWPPFFGSQKLKTVSPATATGNRLCW